MKRTGMLGSYAVVAALALGASGAAPAIARAEASSLADSVLAAIGGANGWERARYFAFDFVARRDTQELRRTSHRWDRYTGEYRLLAKTPDGKPVDVHFDIDDRKGDVRIGGRAADDTTHAQWLDRAYKIFVNDTYWLLMPFKLRDPGVRLVDAGVRTDSTGKAWRVLALTFEAGTGITSRDRYWVYVDPATGGIGRWDYHLESDPADAPPQVAAWENWQEFGPLRLATRRRVHGRPVTISFENMTVESAVPRGVFTDPLGEK